MNRFLPFKKPHKLKTHTSSSVITLPFHEMLTDQHQQLEGLVEKHVSTMPRRPRLVGADDDQLSPFHLLRSPKMPILLKFAESKLDVTVGVFKDHVKNKKRIRSQEGAT